MSIVILGAGHAGGALAATLRQLGNRKPVHLLGDETYYPYQRPPLSKAWLKNQAGFSQVALRADGFYAQREIDVRLGVRATAIDRARRALVLSDGARVPYETLVLAVGARARRLGLPGETAPNVHVLRTIADADRIRAGLIPGRRLVVIGGGFIGLEVAASARRLGMDVEVVEREARLLARVASPLVAQFMQAAHEQQGVRVRLSAAVAGLDLDRGRVRAVRLVGGVCLEADMVLVGVGAMPHHELAREAGLACANGICVDLAGRTDDPCIYAIGDCTERPLPHYASRARLESVASALEQARQAAAAICGTDAPQPEVPWFWSDQYDIKLQMAGLPLGVCRVEMTGDPEQGRFSVAHMDEAGRLCALEAVNMPAAYMAARARIARERPF